jgi:hypothetical protein
VGPNQQPIGPGVATPCPIQKPSFLVRIGGGRRFRPVSLAPLVKVMTRIRHTHPMAMVWIEETLKPGGLDPSHPAFVL